MQTDAKRLKQVLLNLLSNAVKFTPPDGKVTIAAWETATDKNICIEVVDTGIGIAAKDIAKALAPFGQVDSELSRRYEGTGLGLPLTKKFIELLGGTMNLESEVGVGTKITVILPKGATMPDEPTTTNKGIESTSDNFESFQKPKMYVAENPDEKFEIKN
jgi:two-component system cell cycle sensor histidine kinase PleC